MYVCIYVCIYIYVYIYIRKLQICKNNFKYLHIYILMAVASLKSENTVCPGLIAGPLIT